MGRDFENRKHAIFKTAAVKSKLYSKYGKLLFVAAKNGVPDPDLNAALKNTIERAKKEQVPSHVIERAIDKAKGNAGEDYVVARYEGYGPGGCTVVVDCLTDNHNRTISEVRNCFTKTGSKLGAAGSVLHSYDHLALFSFAGTDADAVLEKMLEAEVDVDDVQCNDGKITLSAPASEFFKAKTALLAAYPDIDFETQEITYLPQANKELSGDDVPMFEKFINMLNECEDVQEIYHNAILPK